MSIVIQPASAAPKQPYDFGIDAKSGVQTKVAAAATPQYIYLLPKTTDTEYGASVDRCADVYGNSQEGGARVILWDCRLGAQNQHWSPIEVAGTGSQYGTLMFANRSSGKCLDVNASSTDNGASVIQWNCHNRPNQQWDIVLPAGADPATYSGPISFKNRTSGKCLDLFGGSIDNGTGFLQWDCKGSDNQLFTGYIAE